MRKLTIALGVALATFLLGFVVTAITHNFAPKAIVSFRQQTEQQDLVAKQLQALKEREIADYNSATSLSYLGCWSGMKGGQIEISSDKIYNILGKQVVSYKVILENDSNNTKEFLLELDTEPNFSCLDKFVSVKSSKDFESNNKINSVLIYGYKTKEDYLKDKYTGAGQFVRCTGR